MTEQKRTIGSRYEEMLCRVDAALAQRDLLPDGEQDFLDRLRDRIAQFEAAAFVSAAQLNWLTRIESKLDNRR